ncbi:MAG: hypothetical protein E6J33_01235 [Chloroflexi bacterium]|nr:MAG: hypothetical protein E6J33_01235 [Chloroflexota bacterium]
MSETDATMQKVAVLWLSGARLADIRKLPEVEKLLDAGAMVELDPLPITGLQAQHYQVLSGKSPASFGFFDTLVSRNYAVTEEVTGRGSSPKLLPDLLRTVGWTVAYEETKLSSLVTHLRALMQSVSASPSCLIVKCAISSDLKDTDASTIIQALQALLSDTQPAAVERFVNINNFLAEMGVIERDEQTGQVNWSNSLAYFAGNGQLLVNLLGRDAQGAVHPQDEYEEVRDTLVKALPNKLRNPENGETVIERVYRKEELYSGDYLFCAPDLVVLFKPGYAPSPRSRRIEFDEATFTTPAIGETVVAGVNPAMVTGFLIACAPSLAVRVTEYEHAPLTAVAPTLLHALGVEYVDLESLAIGTLFSSDYLEEHPIRSSMHNQELSEEDEELIIGHLRDLGYV